MGNLLSVSKALAACGARAEVLEAPRDLSEFSGIVLPGVGAFADAATALRGSGWVGEISRSAAAARPLLGICLGMQLLLSSSTEDGEHEGLGLIPGRVVRLASRPGFHVPHMGWNQLRFPRPCPLFRGIPEGEHVYFVHSYYPVPDDPADVIATTDYGGEIPVALQRGSLYGVQFHPEKSQAVGLRILRNFIDLTREKA